MAGIFEDLTNLAVKHNAVNLGQGFPDFLPPQHLLNALRDVTSSPNPLLHQYTRSYGHPRLVRALARLQSGPLGRPVDPLTEIIVSLGAYGALVCAITGLVKPGDDVILIEPFFDCYQKVVNNVGATPVYVTLRPQSPNSQRGLSSPAESDEAFHERRVEEELDGSDANGGKTSTEDSTDLGKGDSKPQQARRTGTQDWKLDVSELEGKITPRTRAIILNNPSNPLGKVFSRQELEDIAEVCRRHDLICISDEVYEWLIYDSARLIKIASLPGMWERTVTVGSAGKMFCATGWKTGWVITPEPLMTHVKRVHQSCYFRPATPIQEALGEAVELEVSCTESSYTAALSQTSQRKRDRLAAMLESVGLRPVIPDGGYFLLADVSPLLHQGALLKNAIETSSDVIGDGHDDLVKTCPSRPSDVEGLDVTEGGLNGREKRATNQKEQLRGEAVSANESTSKQAWDDVMTLLPHPTLPNTPAAKEDDFGIYGETPDVRLMHRLVVERGVAAIPLSPFYCQENKVKAGCFLRFCFVKDDVTLDKAEQRFRQWADDVAPKVFSA